MFSTYVFLFRQNSAKSSQAPSPWGANGKYVNFSSPCPFVFLPACEKIPSCLRTAWNFLPLPSRGKKNYSVRYETSVMVSWHQWKDMKRWTLGKQNRFHVSSMATEYQWGELVREALCLTLCVCLIWSLAGHYPGPLFACPTCLSKAISLTGPAPAATTLAIKSVINTSILNLLLILYHHESFLPFFFHLRGSLFILAEPWKPVANGPGCWQGA